MSPENEIIELLKDKIGLDTASINQSELKSNLYNFMTINECVSPEDFLQLLKSNHLQLLNFAENFLNKESWFFRDKETYSGIYDYIKFNMGQNTDSNFRILSLGCSTGEEPYSIAIHLIESGYNAKTTIIDAVDISSKALETAKQAIYNEDSYKELEPEFKAKYFQEAEDVFILHPLIAQLVNFHKANFIDTNFFIGRKQYDIVLAKNIFEYLTDIASRKLINNISLVLSDSGILVTTKNEITIFSSNNFEKTGYGESILKKINFERHENIKEESIVRNKAQRKNIIQNILKLRKDTLQKGVTVESKPTKLNIANEIQALIKTGQYDSALKYCHELLGEDNQNADVYFQIGLIYEMKNELDNAEDYYHKTLYIEPYHYGAIEKLILLFEMKGLIDKADILKKRIAKIIGKQ